MPFRDIIGHSTPIEWLRRAITSHRLAHAYLFVGDHAIGKRMTALRFIQAMNCETYVDTSSRMPAESAEPVNRLPHVVIQTYWLLNPMRHRDNIRKLKLNEFEK